MYHIAGTAPILNKNVMHTQTKTTAGHGYLKNKLHSRNNIKANIGETDARESDSSAAALCIGFTVISGRQMVLSTRITFDR